MSLVRFNVPSALGVFMLSMLLAGCGGGSWEFSFQSLGFQSTIYLRKLAITPVPLDPGRELSNGNAGLAM